MTLRSLNIPNIKTPNLPRRSIVGCFRYTVFTNRGYSRTGDIVQLNISALVNSREHRLHALGISREITPGSSLRKMRNLLVQRSLALRCGIDKLLQFPICIQLLEIDVRHAKALPLIVC